LANTIVVKQNTSTGNVPSSLAAGELAANTYDGRLFLGCNNGSPFVKEIGASGGGGGSSISMALANNQTSAANVTGLSINSATYIHAMMNVFISRQTDTPTELVESGILHLVYLPKSATWDIRFQSVYGDAGITFSITSGGQVQYVSTNIAGANYVGKLRITNLIQSPV